MNEVQASWQLFQERAALLGIQLHEREVQLCQEYIAAVAAANRSFNLTAYRSLQDLIVKILLDSFSLLPVLAQVRAQSLSDLRRSSDRILDVGAGAGVPGIPLKLVWSTMSLTCVESHRKKADFIQTFGERFNLQISVLCDRAETLGQIPHHRARYDIVTARAVAALPTLCELTLPFTRQGGLVLLPKGPRAEEEVAQASTALLQLGGELTGIFPAQIPGEDEISRWVVVLYKRGTTPPKYPRRPGIPAKRPL